MKGGKDKMEYIYDDSFEYEVYASYVDEVSTIEEDELSYFEYLLDIE